MKKLKIYLDTSVINHLFADDAPDAMQKTIDLFNSFIKTNIYETYVSPIVIDEINKTKDDLKKSKLLSVITDYNLSILNIEENIQEIMHLAQIYIEQEIIPRKKIEDALHIAISSIYEIDALVSWNYKHMANIYKERKIISMNINEGYLHTLRICTPMEVMYDNE